MKNYVVYDAYKTNAVGVWYYVPCDGVFKEGEPSYGFGEVKYNEGSVYVGELYYDGKDFIKHGFGQQDFTYSTFCRVKNDPGIKKYKFVGEYDKDHEWIYGNGVLYYTDEKLRPVHFVKANFNGLKKVGEHKGKFDYSSLLEGFTPDMEFSGTEDVDVILKVERRKNSAETFKSIDVLMLGDSDFDYWDDEEYAGKNTFYNVFPKNYVNVGIGGATFSDWLIWIERFENIAKPRKIVLNLGYNDIHRGTLLSDVYKNYTELLKKLSDYFPLTKIYLVKVPHTPSSRYIKLENDFNNQTENSAEKLNVTIIDWNEDIANSKADCFSEDRVHANEHGYGIFGKKLLKVVL